MPSESLKENPCQFNACQTSHLETLPFYRVRTLPSTDELHQKRSVWYRVSVFPHFLSEDEVFQLIVALLGSQMWCFDVNVALV